MNTPIIPAGFVLVEGEAFMETAGPVYVRRSADGLWDLGCLALPRHANRFGTVHGGMLATLARHAAKALGVRPVDRVFGALFGALRGVLVLVVLAALVLMTPMRDEDWWRTSHSAAWLEMALSWLHPLLPESFGKYLSA